MTPKRIQRKRTKGWKMPANTVSVTRPSKWGNPYKVGDMYNDEGGFERVETAQQAVNLYEQALENYYGFPIDKEQIRKELKGKNLACFCPLDSPCHADVLLKIANE